jgi:hypothetical protein
LQQEKLILKSLEELGEENNTDISEVQQHEFKKKRSMTTATLLSLICINCECLYLI